MFTTIRKIRAVPDVEYRIFQDISGTIFNLDINIGTRKKAKPKLFNNKNFLRNFAPPKNYQTPLCNSLISPFF